MNVFQLNMPRMAQLILALLLGLALLTWAASSVVHTTARGWFERDVSSRARLVLVSARQSLADAWYGDPKDLQKQLIALDRGLRFFLRILDQLYDLSRLFNRDPLLNGDLLFHCASGGWFQRAIGQAFQGHAAFYQLLLKNVIYRLHFEFIGGVQHDRVGALHRDLDRKSTRLNSSHL